jgi:hypothetical protein
MVRYKKKVRKKTKMTPKERTQRFMKIVEEKGFQDMARQMNEEELALLIRSLVPESDPNKKGD